MDLFDYMRQTNQEKEAPLAARLRPRTLDEVVGQQHIIGKDKLLYRAIQADKLSSIIFYGPPGTGKTTLAKLCCGLLKESAGIISIHEKQLPQKKRLGQIFFVMQDSDYQLFGDSVLNELRIGAGNKSSNDAENQAILKKLSLWEKRENHPAALSRGQKQRLTIAGALKADSRVLFFDEPTSGLDLQHMKEVADELITIQEMGRTSLVITHDYELIVSCCTHVLHLEHGAVREQYALDAAGLQRLKDFFIESR